MNLFDPDVSVQNYQPQDLTFPLMAFVEIKQCPNQSQTILETEAPVRLVNTRTGPQLRTAPKILLTLTGYDDSTLPFLVKVLRPEGEPPMWVPWFACSPELTLMLN